MNGQIKTLEEIMLNALPTLNTYYYDEWRLRFAGGYTNRANSVNILEPSTILLEKKIAFCEGMYKKQNLPSVFKISPLCIEVDQLLEQAGYEVVTKTAIMTMDMSNMTVVQNQKCNSVVSEGISEKWQENYFKLNDLALSMIPYAKRVQALILDKVLCAMLIKDDEVLACGMCVLEGEYAGLYDIIVSKEHRHVGLGMDICSSLLQEAYKHGAKKAYLQVVESNTNAVNLYKKLGYQKLYDYWYRVKEK